MAAGIALASPGTFCQPCKVKYSVLTPGQRVAALLTLAAWLPAGAKAAEAPDALSDNVIAQIRAVSEQKAARTPVQRKLDSHLVWVSRRVRNMAAVPGVPRLRTGVRVESDGRVLVDIKADVTAALLTAIERAGGKVVVPSPRFRAVRALLPMDQLETLAAQPDVAFIRRAARPRRSGVCTEGDITHGAALSRNGFGVDGSGIRIGVMSDSVSHLEESQASGELGPVTVLPGQSGTDMSDTVGEGTAMLEIVHDLAPGATLFFATAWKGEASFAENIHALRAAGCDIIVDDINYYDEPVFQDGLIARAVNEVAADGALYFSSASNDGNKNSRTSGTWEGNFADGGAALPSGRYWKGGRLHRFGLGPTYNTVLRDGSVDLFWSDPLGQSQNDYDFYVLDRTGSYVVDHGTDDQTGFQDPYEYCEEVYAGERIVIVQCSGSAARCLHLHTSGGVLSIGTEGATKGHPAASGALTVAAASVSRAYPRLFAGGLRTRCETYSSDGPRRMFFQADGTPFTPGNFLAPGGTLLLKPDLTAADAVRTSVPGFNPFAGTSAAAPHAAAIAALLWSFNRAELTAGDVRAVLLGTALDIETSGWDRDSGAGMALAPPALRALSAEPAPMCLGARMTDRGTGNGNGLIEPGETLRETVVWTNMGAVVGSNVTATLETSTPGVTVLQGVSAYSNLMPCRSATNQTPYLYRVAKTVPAGTLLTFTNTLTASGQTCQGSFTRVVGRPSVGPKMTNVFDNASVGLPILDFQSVAAVGDLDAGSTLIDDVNVSLRLDHPADYDLALALIAPDGQRMLLSDERGGPHANFGTGYGAGMVRTVFDDQAPVSIRTGQAPFAQAYKPESPLTTFRGKPADGLWRLEVSDGYTDGEGSLLAWGLQVVSHPILYTTSVYSTRPVARGQTVTVQSGVPARITLQAGDLDGDPLSFRTNSATLHGALTEFDANSGDLRYTPQPGYLGADSFTFTATDGANVSLPARVTLKVIAPLP